MVEIMKTKELAEYLKLHEITIIKYAAKREIPAIRIGRVWRFDKEAIDKWISEGQKGFQAVKKSKTETTSKAGKGQMPKKGKSKSGSKSSKS